MICFRMDSWRPGIIILILDPKSQDYHHSDYQPPADLDIGQSLIRLLRSPWGSMSDPVQSEQQVTPTTIKRFVRNTARGISNDLVTAVESLEDFLESDPQENPQEAGEAAQIITRQIEAERIDMQRLLDFMGRLKTAELARSRKNRGMAWSTGIPSPDRIKHGSGGPGAAAFPPRVLLPFLDGRWPSMFG